MKRIAMAGWLLAVVGCHAQPPPAATPAPPPPPEPEVVAVPATTREVISYREYTGRTTAVAAVDVRARVSGYLLQNPGSAKVATAPSTPAAPSSAAPSSSAPSSSAPSAAAESRGSGQAADTQVDAPRVEVSEGQLVQRGALLFVIDPQPYRLALLQSQGSLAAAEARLKQANQDLMRMNELLERNATSQAELEQSIAAVAELRGQIENLRATVARNQLDLDFTLVRSPIEGLLGRAEVTAGNLIVADTTILTTVVATDPIYVEFDVDERSLLDYRQRMIQGEVRDARQTQIEIQMGLANEDDFPHTGTIDFVNNVTDPNTGNTRVRARFENHGGMLTPGLFARIRAPFTSPYQAVLVPAEAIAMDQQGRYVMVVGEDRRVTRRGISLGEVLDGQAVIREGLDAGELVITSGLQRVRPGATVRLATGDEA